MTFKYHCNLFSKITVILRHHSVALTLVELLVALTILSAVITLTMSVVLAFQNTQRRINVKYEANGEADRTVKDMETSLRTAQKLLSGTDQTIKFLNVYYDTCEYNLRNDTLLKNKTALTKLQVDSLFIVYSKINLNEKVSDFYFFDDDRDGELDTTELRGVIGINIYITFLYPQITGTKKERIKKEIFVNFRNLQK